MHQDKIIQSLKRQLLIERSIIAVVLLVVLGRWTYTGLAKSPYAVMVDERPLAFVKTQELAEQALSEVKREKAGTVKKVTFEQNVEIKRYRGGSPVVSKDEAADKLVDVLRVRMEKWTIFSNGKPVVAVDSREQAGSILESLKAKYGGRVKNLLEEPQFKENVKVELVDASESLYRKSSGEALEAILHPTEPVKKKGKVEEYIVKNGDIAAIIAQRRGISIDQLQALNPGRNIEKLQIGDKLRVSGNAAAPASGRSRITVVVRDVIDETQQIPYETQTISSTQMFAGKQMVSQPGRNGLRRAKVAVTYENGARTGQQTLEEQIIRQPVSRRVVLGIKTRR